MTPLIKVTYGKTDVLMTHAAIDLLAALYRNPEDDLDLLRSGLVISTFARELYSMTGHSAAYALAIGEYIVYLQRALTR